MQSTPIETASGNQAPPPAAKKEKLVTITLKRHYVPVGLVDPEDKDRRIDTHEIVGWHRPEKQVKRPDGKMVVVEEAAFIEGEAAPPPQPGVGFERKIWSGTTIRVPASEAREMRRKGAGDIEVED